MIKILKIFTHMTFLLAILNNFAYVSYKHLDLIYYYLLLQKTHKAQ